MAGIGVKLNNIYNKNTLTTNITGMAYSTIITIAPMIAIIAALMLMQKVLDFSTIDYATRELFSCTIMYIFIFSLLTVSPLNSVLSRYMSDVIYEERYQDIQPCYMIGMIITAILAACLGIPFCIKEVVVGHVPVFYVFTGYCGYIMLTVVFYSMIYLSICKDYVKISLFFLSGMVCTFVLSFVLVFIFHVEKTFAMLVSFDVGFVIIAALELSVIKSYFRENSGEYRAVLHYLRKYYKLIITNFMYTLGIYVHNFVFWTTDLRIEVVKCFVCVTSYDMATCLAMFTNITTSVIFLSRVEMHFHERYKAYSEAVIGGRHMDIEITKKRMFRQLSEELMSLVRIQFIISVILFFMAIIFLPKFGFGGMVMQIYPCLAAGYFIMFIMYSSIIFLYYFNDLNGGLLTAGTFCIVTLIVSVFATKLPIIWYGIGLVAGAMAGWCVAYRRLRWLEVNLDSHIFCNGNIINCRRKRKPKTMVFNRNKKGRRARK